MHASQTSIRTHTDTQTHYSDQISRSARETERLKMHQLQFSQIYKSNHALYVQKFVGLMLTYIVSTLSASVSVDLQKYREIFIELGKVLVPSIKMTIQYEIHGLPFEMYSMISYLFPGATGIFGQK